jgi:hypothetical protein
MKNVLLSLLAIGIAGVAAIAATTAMLNSPVRPAYIGAPKSDAPADPNKPPAPSSTPPSVPSPGPSPGPAPGPAPAPSTGDDVGGAARPAGAEGAEPEADKDPYEGVAPEELPPDLQYDADANVSFPTNI